MFKIGLIFLYNDILIFRIRFTLILGNVINLKNIFFLKKLNI